MNSLTKIKRLSRPSDNISYVPVPIPSREITSRQNDYVLLTPSQFARKYSEPLFRPVDLYVNGEKHQIQINFCIDPTCRWFGRGQEKFTKKSRYRLNGVGDTQTIVCNEDSDHPGGVWNNFAKVMSNWSAAEEVARLIRIESTVPLEEEYVFHRGGCPETDKTPFEQPKAFYRRRKSTAKSQKWQCRACRKITNVLPDQKYNHAYHQKRNDILPKFAKMVVSRIPVRRTCELLEISSETYYHKLEWLYRKCLEFLERYEKQPLASKEFRRIWIQTDQMTYHLNNVKRRGRGGHRHEQTEDPVLPTNVIISTEMRTRYALRADVAFDWDVRLDDIDQTTKLYKDDRLHDFARRYARIRYFSAAPQKPSTTDISELMKHAEAEYKFQLRNKYVEGLHIVPTYTTYAHYWLIRRMIHSKEWRFVSDEDTMLTGGLFRSFTREFQTADAHHFLCKVDDKKTKTQAYREYEDGVEALKQWAVSNSLDDAPLHEVARHMLEHQLKFHHFYNVQKVNGKDYRQATRQTLQHPLPSEDHGYHKIGCTTDIYAYTDEEISRMLLRVTNRSTDAFIQQIRRRISTLERPLKTTGLEGVSYIYANFNPKYAQYWITILRVYYNFMVPSHSKKKEHRKTPAQKLGLTDKVFRWEDILYFR